jgi:hypothetical protein
MFSHSESDLEAEQSRETLQDLVEQLLESNHEISRRLRSIEDSCDSQSTLTRPLTNDSTEISETDNSTVALDTLDSNEISLKSFDFQFDTVGLSFENDLKLSRVYSRTQLYESDVSFTTSVVRTHAWSIYSGLSLAEASVISAIALPLYSHDISNSQWYKFEEASRTDPQQTIPIKSTPSTFSTTQTTVSKSASAVSKIRDYASEMRRYPRRKSAPSERKEVSKMRLYKLVVLGDGGVGKDELVTQVSICSQAK